MAMPASASRPAATPSAPPISRIRDPARQGEKVGDRLEFNIKRDDSGWRGQAYDPQRKLTFSASLSANVDSMTTKGCMLAVVCRTTNWQRLPGASAAQ